MLKISMIASLMLLGNYCLAQNDYYQDSLQIEIGSKARILFQAREKADFELIRRYDLNKLFEELLLRSAQGDSASTELLNLIESKKFANSKTLKASFRNIKEIFLRFNYGLYMGYAPGQNIQLPHTTHTYTLDDLQGVASLKHTGNLNLTPAMMTIGASVDGGILLKNRPRLNTEFKLSLGYERSDFQKNFSRNVQYSFQGDHILSESETKTLNLYYDKIAGGLSIGSFNNYQQFSQVYLQFMPQVELKNQDGKSTWRLGLGVRGITMLQGKGRNFQWLSTFDHPTKPFITTPTTLLSAPYLWGVVGRLSYKSIGFTVHYTPRILSVISEDSIEGSFYNHKAQYFNSWFFGLRWGIY